MLRERKIKFNLTNLELKLVLLPDDDIEYIEKLRQNKKFKDCRVFMIHKLILTIEDINIEDKI